MSQFSLDPYNNVLQGLDQCPRSKPGLSLWVPKDPGGDGGGGEGVIWLSASWTEVTGLWWPQGLRLTPVFSAQLLLRKFHG